MDKIIFYFNGEKVGESELPPHTFCLQRNELAYNAGVKEYNDFEIVSPDGSIKAVASKVFGFWGEGAIDSDLGSYEGIKYKEYLMKLNSNPSQVRDKN